MCDACIDWWWHCLPPQPSWAWCLEDAPPPPPFSGPPRFPFFRVQRAESRRQCGQEPARAMNGDLRSPTLLRAKYDRRQSSFLISNMSLNSNINNTEILIRHNMISEHKIWMNAESSYLISISMLNVLVNGVTRHVGLVKAHGLFCRLPRKTILVIGSMVSLVICSTTKYRWRCAVRHHLDYWGDYVKAYGRTCWLGSTQEVPPYKPH